ncbi:MAG: VWA domain-containing protein [Cyanobacteria bacterium J06638_22]
MTTPTSPTIELLPLRAALAQNQETTLDLLIRIVPPALEMTGDRPPLNLGLVIDRSGSMSGKKIEYARQAAIYAVQQLQPSDRVSVVAFDSSIKTLIPNTLATDKDSIIQKLESLRPGSSTALHAGWLEGGIQVGHGLKPEWLNRILVLSDGLANVGETNPDAIASDVHGLTQRGISTSTMGMGDNYGEDLMEAMARSGDGNFYHIESPEQLPDFFQSELRGLMATVGHTVSLGVEPRNGVTVVDILNNLDKTTTGRLKLPNLVAGNSISVVVRLKVPPQSALTDLCRIRLAWNDPEVQGRQEAYATLTLPVVDAAQLSEFPPNEAVQQQVALLMSARAQEETIRLMDQGDFEAAQNSLRSAKAMVASAPCSADLMMEEATLGRLQDELTSGNTTSTRKLARFNSHRRSRSQTSTPGHDSKR